MFYKSVNNETLKLKNLLSKNNTNIYLNLNNQYYANKLINKGIIR